LSDTLGLWVAVLTVIRSLSFLSTPIPAPRRLTSYSTLSICKMPVNINAHLIHHPFVNPQE